MLHLKEGLSAARTDIGPRRAPNAKYTFTVASLVYDLYFHLQFLSSDWAFQNPNQRTVSRLWDRPTFTLVRLTISSVAAPQQMAHPYHTW
jgi:hypothetical protein